MQFGNKLINFHLSLFAKFWPLAKMQQIILVAVVVCW